MSGKLKVLLLAAIVAGAGWWWTHRATPLVNAPPPPGSIVAFGDSLTAGVGAEPDQSYVTQLGRMIGRPVVNAGAAGDTIEQAARRLERDVFSHRPGLVIVLLGGNDLLRQLELDASFARLEDLVRQIQDRGAMVALVGIKGLSPLGSVQGRYAALARRTGALYVPDILDGILGNPPFMSDQVHPNAQGYRIMAERIAKAIRSYLPPPHSGG